MLVETRYKQLSEHKRYMLQLNNLNTLSDSKKIRKIKDRLRKVEYLLNQNDIDFANTDYVKVEQEYSGKSFKDAENLLKLVLEKLNVNNTDFFTRRLTYLVDIKIAISFYLRERNYTLQSIANLLKCHHASVVNLLKKDLKYYPEVVKIIDEIDKINQEANNE